MDRPSPIPPEKFFATLKQEALESAATSLTRLQRTQSDLSPRAAKRALGSALMIAAPEPSGSPRDLEIARKLLEDAQSLKRPASPGNTAKEQADRLGKYAWDHPELKLGPVRTCMERMGASPARRPRSRSLMRTPSRAHLGAFVAPTPLETALTKALQAGMPDQLRLSLTAAANRYSRLWNTDDNFPTQCANVRRCIEPILPFLEGELKEHATSFCNALTTIEKGNTKSGQNSAKKVLASLKSAAEGCRSLEKHLDEVGSCYPEKFGRLKRLNCSDIGTQCSSMIRDVDLDTFLQWLTKVALQLETIHFPHLRQVTVAGFARLKGSRVNKITFPNRHTIPLGFGPSMAFAIAAREERTVRVSVVVAEDETT